jgi:lipopolysaccharide export system protein LptA
MSIQFSQFSRLRQTLIMVAVASACLAPAWAERADRNKPMNAEADSLRYDDAKQISVFTGNVVITKGTLIIRGDRVEVRQDAEGYQFGTSFGTTAKRAFFRQKRDTPAGAPEEWIEGEAETITYDGKADTVTFNKTAVLRRYRGAQVADESTGNLITYDNTTDVYNVAGGPNSGNPGGRVRVMLSPRTTAPASAPAAPASAPAPVLRPSVTIGGDKK